MPGSKSISRGKSHVHSKNGVHKGDKGVVVARHRSNGPSSDSDDDDVMRQLLSPTAKKNGVRTDVSRRRATNRRDVGSDGPGSDSDNRGSPMSDDEDDAIPAARRALGGATDSPATTPAGSPNQTPGPTTSSSDAGLQQADGMDIDSERGRPVRPSSDRPGRGPQARSGDIRAPEPTGSGANFQIAYIPCHTWPPCAVCARIAGQPPPAVAQSSFMIVRQRQLELAREAARNAPPPPPPPPPHMPALHSATQPLRPPPILRSLDNSMQTEYMPPPPPLSPPPPPYDPPHIGSSRAAHRSPTRGGQPASLARMPPPYGPNTYAPPNYPMEPLFVSAGIAHDPNRNPAYRPGLAPPSASARPTPASTPGHVIRPVTLSSVANPVRHSPYPRPVRNPQASSSARTLEDTARANQGQGSADGPARQLRGSRKQKAKKVRAKRYNRKKREEWPPEGWNPIWEEEKPRRWEGYDIPDEITPDKVYDHLRRRFELKSMGHCKWEGCVPTEASKDGYKMLKRHVETVHLGLKLVCRLCGVRKRADNRRKATHKRGCPEREDGTIAMPPSLTLSPGSGPTSGDAHTQSRAAGKARATGDNQQDVQMEEDELLDDDDGQDYEEGDDGDEEELDELEDDDEEEDQLDEDQEEQGQRVESEYESEDD